MKASQRITDGVAITFPSLLMYEKTTQAVKTAPHIK